MAVSILRGLQPPLPWNKRVPKYLPSVWLLVCKRTARKFLDKWNEKEERWRSGGKKGTEGKMGLRVYCPGDPAKAGVRAPPLGGGTQWPWSRSRGQGGSTSSSTEEGRRLPSWVSFILPSKEENKTIHSTCILSVLLTVFFQGLILA